VVWPSRRLLDCKMPDSIASRVVAFALIACIAVQCLSSCLQAVRECRKCSMWLRSLWNACRRLASQKDSSSEDDDVGKFVAREVARRCASRAGFIISFSCKLACFTSLGIVSNSLNDQPRWMTFEQDVIHMLNFILLLIGSCAPSSIRPSTLSLWYVVLSIELILFCAWSSDEMFLYACLSSYMQRLIYALVPTHTSVVVVMNACQIILLGFVYSQKQVAEQVVAHQFDLTGFVLLEVFCSAICIVLTWSIRASMSAELVRDAKTKSLQKEKSATQRLLALMCDVVVELDRDLRFVEHVAKFSAIFTLSAQHRDLKGAKLCDFMLLDEERERFESLLEDVASSCEDASASSAPGAMHATMRASDDSKVRVELFFVTYHDFGESPRFLVGIHEVMDQPIGSLPRFTRAQRRTSPAAMRANGGTILVSRNEPNASDEVSMSSTSTAPTRNEESDLLLTSEQSKDVTMMLGLLSWRIQSKASCCYLHALLKEGRHTLRRLGASGCRRDVSPSLDGQCAECGILARWSDASCGEDGASWCRICEAATVRKVHRSTKLPL